MSLFVLVYAAGAHAQPSLTVTGNCPGPVQVDMVGLTPGGTVAAIHGDAPGADAIPDGAPSCGGILTGLSGVKLYALLDDSDNDGEFHLNPNAPNPRCGRFVQLVDLATCQTSNVVQLLTGTCEVSGRMALIPGGRFQMGSPVGELGRDADETQHWVTLTHSYCIDKTQVTQAEFESVTGVNPSAFQGCPACPVEKVSWPNAARYANAVSIIEGLTPCYSCSWQHICDIDCQFYGGPGFWDWVCNPAGNPYTCEGYRLPTEAEWERAARGGLVGASFPNGGNLFPGDEGNCNGGLLLTDGSLLDDVGWYCGNVPAPLGTPEVVGQLLPNAFGLFDMSGNVYDWCHDGFDGSDYGPDAVVNPIGVGGGGPLDGYAIRGAHMWAVPLTMRVADRRGASPYYGLDLLGVRLARSNP